MNKIKELLGYLRELLRYITSAQFLDTWLILLIMAVGMWVTLYQGHGYIRMALVIFFAIWLELRSIRRNGIELKLNDKLRYIKKDEIR
jgi:hypothetical protein